MTKYIIFENELDAENVGTLIDSAQHYLDQMGDADILEIQISTPGGSPNIAACLLRFLEENRDRIWLYCYFAMGSAGFDIVIKAPNVIMGPDCNSLVHLTSVDVSVSEIPDPQSESGWNLRNVQKKNEKELSELALLGFTKDELSDIAKGHYIVIGRDRLLRMREMYHK